MALLSSIPRRLRSLTHQQRVDRTMAFVIVGGANFPLAFRSNGARCSLIHLRNRSLKFFSASRICASVSSALPERENPALPGANYLACPICYTPLISRNSVEIKDTPASPENGLICSSCRKSYASNEAYLDLTISTGSGGYEEIPPPSAEFFRSPLLSFLYERGWRQNFVLGGFPGLEKEFEMAKEYLKPTFGGVMIDASCGSGLFSRLFSKNRIYSLVVALDFSENMLRQCNDFIDQEGLPRENLVLVRADIARLPFVSGSVDAVHAGAALHCWPSPSDAVSEISRVLRPGGVFVATTFILDGIMSIFRFPTEARQFYSGFTGQQLYFSEGELEDLCRLCGLINFTAVRNGFFVMLSATKPL